MRKVVKTPGQRLCEYSESLSWQSLSGSEKQLFEDDAKTLEIPPLEQDVPETDMDLWDLATEDAQKTVPEKWSPGIETVVPFFAQRLRERDGTYRNVAQEQIDALKNFLREEGKNRPMSEKHPVGSAIRYIEGLERDGTKEPLDVTHKDIESWRVDWSNNGQDRDYDFFMAAKINAHRGVRPVPKVTAEMCREAVHVCWKNIPDYSPSDMADYLNDKLAEGK